MNGFKINLTDDKSINQIRMTKVNQISETKLNIFVKNDFSQIIKEAKLEYQSDISWSYRAETKNYCIDFNQDETGKNHIEEFAVKVNGLWVEILPTDEQLRMMFEKLNNTPYREVEPEPVYISDHYDYNGVQPSTFY